jgi:molybdopterin synthase sulfur carrier subunit
MRVLYFAWLREKAGVSEETITPPQTVATVADLIEWQRHRGDGFGEAFADASVVKVAVTQEHVGLDHPVSAGDEVAFFPPVTGG